MEKQIYVKAIETWGVDTQVNKLQEELLELALILNQMNCITKQKFKLERQLYDELADVSIMMAQARLIFDKERIDRCIASKLERLESILT